MKRQFTHRYRLSELIIRGDVRMETPLEGMTPCRNLSFECRANVENGHTVSTDRQPIGTDCAKFAGDFGPVTSPPVT